MSCVHSYYYLRQEFSGGKMYYVYSCEFCHNHKRTEGTAEGRAAIDRAHARTMQANSKSGCVSVLVMTATVCTSLVAVAVKLRSWVRRNRAIG
jgi:hypothetical protein